jgi:hypothetical protein
MDWQLLHPGMTLEHLGAIPEFLDEADPRPAKAQFAERYVSGWSPMQQWELRPGHILKYPGDPAMKPLARLDFRDETILLYQYAFVVIVQKDGAFEVSRMD